MALGVCIVGLSFERCRRARRTHRFAALWTWRVLSRPGRGRQGALVLGFDPILAAGRICRSGWRPKRVPTISPVCSSWPPNRSTDPRAQISRPAPAAQHGRRWRTAPGFSQRVHPATRLGGHQCPAHTSLQPYAMPHRRPSLMASATHHAHRRRRGAATTLIATTLTSAGGTRWL